MIVLITGGSGYIGQKLTTLLRSEGHEVRILSRTPKDQPSHYYWSLDKKEMDRTALEGVEAVIHLTGTGIAEMRWTDENKKVLMASRIDPALYLKEEMDRHGTKLRHVVSMSATGYYGDRKSELLPESASPGNDFLAQLCVGWEKAGLTLGENSENTSILRTGILMGDDSMFARRVKPVIRMGIGAPLGTGDQYTPWIHSTDVVRFIAAILKDEVPAGTYNLAAPEVVTNKQLMKAVAAMMHRKILLPPVPGFVLKIMFGEMKLALVESARLDLSKIKNTGFQFEYPTLSTLSH